MCDLCGTPEEQKVGRDSHLDFAEDLKRLAHMYAQMGNGVLKPHTDDMKRVVSLATAVIRRLVDEWV